MLGAKAGIWPGHQSNYVFMRELGSAGQAVALGPGKGGETILEDSLAHTGPPHHGSPPPFPYLPLTDTPTWNLLGFALYL